MQTFKEVSNIRQYLINAIRSRGFTAALFKKVTRVQARQGKVGEIVATVMKNGLQETVNTVKADPETGNPGWIITNRNGEKYIVDDKEFCEKYEAVPGEAGVFAPIGKPIPAVQIDENICFIAPWGEEMRLAGGGWLMIAGSDNIYGIQKEEFEQTYTRCACDCEEVTKQVLALLQKE